MTDPYLDEIRTSVAPLAARFGLTEVSSRASSQHVALRLANATTGVEFAVEWRDLRPLVTLFELTSKGEFVDLHDPRQQSNHRRVSFDADDLLLLRKPQDSPIGKRLRRKAPGEVARVMKLYAQALSDTAADVFGGDFSVFEKLDTIVRDRTRALGEENN